MEYSENGFGIPRPDLYIYLDIPIEVTSELLMKKGERAYLNGAKKDQLEEDKTHQIEAARMYQKLSREIPGIVTINCMNDENTAIKSREDIHELVWEKVTSFMDKDLKEGRVNKERQ